LFSDCISRIYILWACKAIILHSINEFLLLLDIARTIVESAMHIYKFVLCVQGLAELYEASGNFDKVVEACESIIEIAKATDDTPRLTDYLCRLARAHVKSLDYEKASETWNVLLGIPLISETQRVEALCGVADAQVVKLNKLREQPDRYCLPQGEPTCSLGEIDISRPVTFPATVAPAASTLFVDDIKMFHDTVNSLEALLQEIVLISPQTQRYQDLLLKLLLDHMQEVQSLGGTLFRMLFFCRWKVFEWYSFLFFMMV
jgi:hypothetical protein